MHEDVERVIVSRRRIAARVAELARQIAHDHAAPDGSPGEITIVPVLTGAMVFAADLIRRLPMRIRIGVVTVSSYPGRTVTSQGPALLHSGFGDLAGRNVLLVDDILDTGATLSMVHGLIQASGPATLRTCVLLRKIGRQSRDITADYIGFDIPDVFVVGYGLDFGDYHRNLPDIVKLRPAAMAGAGRHAEAR